MEALQNLARLETRNGKSLLHTRSVARKCLDEDGVNLMSVMPLFLAKQIQAMFRVLDESAMVGMRELGKRMCNRIRKIRRNQWKLLELFTTNMLAILKAKKMQARGLFTT